VGKGENRRKGRRRVEEREKREGAGIGDGVRHMRL